MSSTEAEESPPPAATNGNQEEPQQKQQHDKPAQRRRSNIERGLSTTVLSFRIPASHDAKQTAEDFHGTHHWKVKVFDFLHSDPVQYILMALLLLDVAVLFVELFLQATYPPCHTIERDAISCCPAFGDNATTTHSGADASEEHMRRFLAETAHADEGGHHSLCMSTAVESHEYEATCDPHKWETVHNTEKILFALTITILSTFLFELMVMIVILHRAFFMQFFYVLDLFIVSTSLALEILFKKLDEDALISVAGLLVFGRIWRFVRIGHGLVEVTADYAHKDKEALLSYSEELEGMLQQHGIDLPKESHRVKHIKKHAAAHNSFNESN